MLRLRFILGLFVWWLFLFYNIERINEPINIASFVYVLAPAAAGVLMIAPPIIKRRNFLFIVIPTLGVYFALKVGLGYRIFGQWLPLTITEIVGLVLTLLLAQRIGAITADFEDTIESLTFQQIGLPAKFFETVHSEELYREVKRSRRFQHPLVMLVVEPDLADANFELNKLLVDLQKTMAGRYAQARVAKMLTEELRDSDMVAQENHGFVVMLVETSPDDANKVVGRLRAQALSELGVELKVGTADFPDTSLTFGGLLDAARRDLRAFEESRGAEKVSLPGPATLDSVN